MSTVENAPVKRSRGRPRKEDAVVNITADDSQQPVTSSRNRKRTPVSGTRNVLTVSLKPDLQDKYALRWVKDETDGGSRIQRFMQAGYEFVNQDEVYGVGDGNIHFKASVGSVIRVPAGKEYTPKGEPVYLYLMKQPKDFYDEDQKAKKQGVDEKERAVLNQFQDREGEGAYGSIKIQR